VSPFEVGWNSGWKASKRSARGHVRHTSKLIGEFLAYLGPTRENRALELVTEADVRGFAALLRKGGPLPSTVNKLIRQYLSVPFEKAKRQGLIRFNPVTATDPEQADSAQRDTFSPEQVSRLVSSADDRDWAGAIIAWGCGGRLQDIANLKWSSLDLQYAILSFRDRKGHLNHRGLAPGFHRLDRQRVRPRRS